jgi:hypothetical protein
MVDNYMLQIDIQYILYIVSGGATDRDILIVVEMLKYIVSGGHATDIIKIYCRCWTCYT